MTSTAVLKTPTRRAPVRGTGPERVPPAEPGPMRLTPIALPPRLARHIHAMWLFESAVGLPAGDARIVVPNGRPKLIVPWRNGLSAEGDGRRHDFRTGDCVLIGLWDAPTVISSRPEPTVSIGVEFTPTGLCRFVDLPAHELAQRIERVDAVLGAIGDRLIAQVMSAETPASAAAAVVAFLIERLDRVARPDGLLVDAALSLMIDGGFRSDVQEIERRLGYSRRHLAAQFQRHVGIAPKRLNSILAFERLYRSFSRHGSADRLRDDALDLFCDQSHFIRHFKDFTGASPGRFADLRNDFGRIFYL